MGDANAGKGATAAQIVGRLLFGGYFIYNGINHFRHRQQLAEYARAKHVVAPEAAVMASGALLVAGGLSVLAGKPRLGASLITTFLLGVTPKMHAYWLEDDESRRAQEFVNFTKNLALIGGATLAAAART